MKSLNSQYGHQEFGALVGITRQAVGELLSRGVIQPGQSAAQWLLDYTANLREHAAGRGANGELAHQRSEESRVRREINEIKLAAMRGEYAPVSLLEQVLATVGRTIAGVLEPLHVNLQKRCPELTPEALKLIQLEVSKACDRAVNASLAVLDEVEESSDTMEEEGAPHEDDI
jgi:phage terminase Nu1 subunit (DNA packaging protein)